MALIILRIKEVVPLHQANKNISNFFHHDVKVVRDYNKTIHENDLESGNLSASTLHRSRLAQSIVKRWKTIKGLPSQTNQQIERPTVMHDDSGLAHDENDNTLTIDAESRRKLLCLKQFAAEYNLDVFDKRDYHLLTPESREKVSALANDLLDVCEEQDSTVLDEIRHLQPNRSHTSINREKRSFYEEITELLPPKWCQLFLREQKRRQIMSWPSTISQSELMAYKKHNSFSQRRSTVPAIRFHSSTFDQDNEISIENYTSSSRRPSMINQIPEDK